MMDKKSILLAEDDENLGTLLENYLKVKGFEVTLYSDGKKAMEGFSTGHFRSAL